MVNVSHKELYTIENLLNNEKMLIEKYRTCAAEFVGTPLGDKLADIASVHQKHFNTLLGYLR